MPSTGEPSAADHPDDADTDGRGGADQRVVEALARILQTETKARVYVGLRQSPHATSDELATMTGLYPSTVREVLAQMHEEEVVSRRKRDRQGAGNNPYEYDAIAPAQLVRRKVDELQAELNSICLLDDLLGRGQSPSGDGPVRISIDEE
jgi:predicted transcriptional regulator